MEMIIQKAEFCPEIRPNCFLLTMAIFSHSHYTHKREVSWSSGICPPKSGSLILLLIHTSAFG